MCTSIVEVIDAEGAGKSSDGWFAVSQAVVSYDHPHYALLEEAITLDFVNPAKGPSARAAVELTLESAKALSVALNKAIAAAESGEDGALTRAPSKAVVRPAVESAAVKAASIAA